MRRNNHIFILLLAGIALLFSCHTSRNWTKEVQESRKEHIDGMVNYKRPVISESDTQNIHYFPLSEDWRILGRIISSQGTDTTVMPTYSGREKIFIRYAEVELMINQKKDTISLFQNVKLLENEEYKNHLFVPFKDLTSGVTTYGGGRYIDLSLKDIKKQQVLIDFNQCYNPWCAYSDGFNCPIPPRENHLRFEVLAGEKTYLKHDH